MAPPDLNFDSLGDILGSLSPEDFQKISSLADTFISGQSTNNSESQQKDESGMPFDPEMLLRLMSIIEKLNSSRNDPRCNLITALKPLLSAKRRQKADQALELLKILSIFSDDNIFSV